MFRADRSLALGRLVALSLGLSACADPERYEPAEVVWRGEHVDLAYNPDTVVCGGSAQFVDELGRMRLKELGGATERIRYFVLTASELAAVPNCGDALARCSIDAWVYTAFGVDEHELVHAARQAALGSPLPGPIALEEGLAEFHSGHDTGHSVEPERLVESLGEPVRPPAFALYPTLAHYTAFLADSQGVAKTVDFVAAAHGATTDTELEPVFQSAFGITWRDAIADYSESYPTCSSFDMARHDLACAIEPEPWQDDVTIWADLTLADLSCAADHALGPRLGLGGDEIWTYLTIDVEHEGFYSVRTPDNAEATAATAELTACGLGCAADPRTLGRKWSGVISDQLFLVPGRYLVKLSRPLSEPGFVGFELRQSPL